MFITFILKNGIGVCLLLLPFLDCKVILKSNPLSNFGIDFTLTKRIHNIYNNAMKTASSSKTLTNSGRPLPKRSIDSIASRKRRKISLYPIIKIDSRLRQILFERISPDVTVKEGFYPDKIIFVSMQI